MPCGGQALGQIAPVQQHGVVAREVAQVVRQHHQAQLADLRVGGVNVGHVDLALRQRLVRQAVVQPAGRLRQAVAPGQARPAVGAADEFVGQAELQLRQAGQVAQLGHAKGRGLLCPHGQRVAVVEAQRHAHAKAQGRQRAVQVGHAGVAGVLDDFLRDGAGVFGVHVNLAGTQRLIDDGGVAQALAHLRRLARGAHGLRRDLGQDVRLGKPLGAHAQLARRARRLRQRGHRSQAETQKNQTARQPAARARV